VCVYSVLLCFYARTITSRPRALRRQGSIVGENNRSPLPFLRIVRVLCVIFDCLQTITLHRRSTTNDMSHFSDENIPNFTHKQSGAHCCWARAVTTSALYCACIHYTSQTDTALSRTIFLFCVIQTQSRAHSLGTCSENDSRFIARVQIA
jgi:hypothetical protein